ncbi:MAG: DNA polymerase I [candidate division FCPU426 bacterium]
MKKKLLLIDGTAQLYRAFYAIKELTDPKGRPVNAVFGFAQTLLNLIETFSPTHAAAVFDRPEPTHRHQQFPAYKAQREAVPEALVEQIPLVKSLTEAFAVRPLEQPGWEADDLIGTLARRAQDEDFEVLIFSNDKDLLQLVGQGVSLVKPQRAGQKEYEVLDPARVEAFFGVPPTQVADVLALMGDSSDNIPGVPGVGPKTAVELIRTHGSLAALYRSLDRVPQAKLREKLSAHQAAAEQAFGLVVLRQDAPLSLKWQDLALPAKTPDAALALLAELGFKRLLLRQGAAPAVAGAWAQELSAAAATDAVLAEARQAGLLAVESLPQGLALAASTRTAAWLPYPDPESKSALTDLLAAQPGVTAVLNDPAVAKIGYDLKPVDAALRRLGSSLQGSLDDLHLAAHLLDLPSNRPADFVARLLGGPPPEDKLAVLACAWLLVGPNLLAQLAQGESERLYREVELPLLPVLAAMEARGVAVDSRALSDMAADLGREMAELENEINGLAGGPFNLRSTQQLAEVLFDRLGLASGKKTKTGRSTSVDVLEQLAAQHPLPQKILDYRQAQKLKSTYLDVLPQLVDPRDRRVHTTFHQVGAATGRLSSSDPNLQNIPVRTERGRQLRRMFVPGEPGYCLLSADYSQIELRLLAHLSGDPRMIADFEQGLDIHQATAADIFNVPREQVTPEMRRQAKTCNFGIAYGVSPFGLARQLRISNQRAKSFIDGFYARYPRVRRYLDQLLTDARRQGFVATFMGRRRSTPDVASANRAVREAGERMAINTPIQGAAADLIKLAMVAVAKDLEAKRLQSRMILQVHDELLFEGPEAEMPGLRDMVVARMGGIVPLKVPLVVEAAWGRNWMEAHG